jgi:hypothetical protein
VGSERPTQLGWRHLQSEDPAATWPRCHAASMAAPAAGVLADKAGITVAASWSYTWTMSISTGAVRRTE